MQGYRQTFIWTNDGITTEKVSLSNIVDNGGCLGEIGDIKAVNQALHLVLFLPYSNTHPKSFTSECMWVSWTGPESAVTMSTCVNLCLLNMDTKAAAMFCSSGLCYSMYYRHDPDLGRRPLDLNAWTDTYREGSHHQLEKKWVCCMYLLPLSETKRKKKEFQIKLGSGLSNRNSFQQHNWPK